MLRPVGLCCETLCQAARERRNARAHKLAIAMYSLTSRQWEASGILEEDRDTVIGKSLC